MFDWNDIYSYDAPLPEHYKPVRVITSLGPPPLQGYIRIYRHYQWWYLPI
jgi:hypothetical protein